MLNNKREEFAVSFYYSGSQHLQDSITLISQNQLACECMLAGEAQKTFE